MRRLFVSTPLCMPVATPIPYSTSSNPTVPVIITLSLYLFALLLSACILRYYHQCSNPLPYECHTSRPPPPTNLPICPRPTLNRSDSLYSLRLESTPYIPSSLPPLSSSAPSKDSPVTKRTSPVNSLSNFSTTLPSPRSSISEPARATYLTFLDSCFTPPSPSCLDLSSNYSTPMPSTATWRSSQAKSFTQPSDKSTSPSPELNNNTTVDRQEPSPSLPPFPWPFKFPHVPPHLLPPR